MKMIWKSFALSQFSPGGQNYNLISETAKTIQNDKMCHRPICQPQAISDGKVVQECHSKAQFKTRVAT